MLTKSESLELKTIADRMAKAVATYGAPAEYRISRKDVESLVSLIDKIDKIDDDDRLGRAMETEEIADWKRKLISEESRLRQLEEEIESEKNSLGVI